MCTLCNESHLDYKNGIFSSVGSPTETALRVLVEKMDVEVPESVHADCEHPHERNAAYFNSKSVDQRAACFLEVWVG